MSDSETASVDLNDVPTPARTKTFMTFHVKERENVPLLLSSSSSDGLPQREREEETNQSTSLLSQPFLLASYHATAQGESPASAHRAAAKLGMQTSAFPLMAVGPYSTLGDGDGPPLNPQMDRWRRTPGRHSEYRYRLAKVLENIWTDRLFTLLVLLHAFVLTFVGREADPFPEPPRHWGETWDEYVLLGIFLIYTLHIMARIIVYGLFQPHLDESLAFMRHSWNRTDFIAVASYWMDFGLTFAGEALVNDRRQIVLFRALSTLILLRLLLITRGNRVILQSLKKAGPLLVTVTYFVVFFFIILAIIGVQSFKGSYMRRCVWQDPHDLSNYQILQQYCGAYIEDGVKKPYLFRDGSPAPWPKGFVCEEGLTCQEVGNPYGGTISFDNIFNSMLLVIITAGSQTWTEPMYDMMDAEYGVACLYFIAIVIVMNFWLINLFVAVINETFAKIRRDSRHSAFTISNPDPLLTDLINEWTVAQQAKAQDNLLVDFCRVSHPFWVVLVAADLLAMGSKNNEMSRQQLELLDCAECWFSMAFMVEIILRFVSSFPTWRRFFSSKANCADLIIAVMTCIIHIPMIHDNYVLYASLTGFQVIRVYRLVIAIPRLRALSSRVLGSVWGLLNLVFFIVLATLVTAIMGFQLLENTLNDSDSEMRFFSIYNSFVGLNQLFSGEDWTTVLYDAMEAGAPTKTSAIHALYLVLWFLSSNFVMVNMFIAVLMENFETAEEEKRVLQIQQYIAQNQQTVSRDPIVSRWNVYRYFHPHPKAVRVDNIPHGLVLPATTTVVSDFMRDDASIAREDELAMAGPSTPSRKSNGLSIRFRRFFEDIFPIDRTAPLSNTRKSMAAEFLNPLDLLREQTTYNYGTQPPVNGQRSDPFSMIRLLTNITGPKRNVIAEAMIYDMEGRKAGRQEFISSHPTYDRPLYLFSQTNMIRRICQKLVPPSRGMRQGDAEPSTIASWIFFWLISAAAVTTVVLTIYNSPVYQVQHPQDQVIFRQLDWIFMFIFTAEMVIKVVADGFLFTPNAYLLNGWNILDLMILATLYISHLGEFASATGVERGFRALKALRALRLMNLLRPAREMFTFILVKGLFLIIDTALLCLFLIVPFALYGQNLFQGLFYGCNDDAIGHRSLCINEGMLGTQQPMPEETMILAPRLWENPYVYSFDSFWKGLLVLVEIASGEGWIDVLERSMSLAGKDLNHERDISQYMGIFFMVYNLIGSILVISLFLGIVLENFSHRSGSAYLTADQRRWTDLKKLLNQTRPAKRPSRAPASSIRQWCFWMVDDKSSKFYTTMKMVIMLNILLLCTEFQEDRGAFAGFSRVRENIRIGFLVIYWVEIVIKLLALGWKSFRRNKSNLFDLAVVLGATGTVIGGTHMIAIEANKLFMTALCFKLVQRSDNLNQLFTITAGSAYQIVNVFAVWAIIMITYAIVFMQIFGLTKYGTQATSEHVNFRTFASTMISLVRFSTGEAWNTVMHDFTVQYPNCVVADDFLNSDCGSPAWSFVLFLSFNIISMYLFTAIFVAVVSENFSYVYQIASNYSLVNRDEIRKFKSAWGDIDTNRTGTIMSRDAMRFWRKLGGVFRVRIYDPGYSYKSLYQQCRIPSSNRKKNANEDPYCIRVDVNLLGQKLVKLDKTELHQRKHILDSLYWEAELVQSTKGSISFNAMLLMVARRKLVIPENAFQLDELLYNRRREDVIQTLIKIDRVKGMLETYALRKKFLQHLHTKNKRRTQRAPAPADQPRRISGMLGMMSFFTHSSAPASPTMEDTFKAAAADDDDNASLSPNSDDPHERDLWQDLLLGELE